MALFGFLTKEDLIPLQDKIDVLEYQVQVQQDKIEEQQMKIEALQKYCYNVGGELTLLKRQVASLQETLGQLSQSSPPA